MFFFLFVLDGIRANEQKVWGKKNKLRAKTKNKHEV